ncbi:MAG: hypothetical protein AB7S81_04555 [Bdellovibrionales bacterium]
MTNPDQINTGAHLGTQIKKQIERLKDSEITATERTHAIEEIIAIADQHKDKGVAAHYLLFVTLPLLERGSQEGKNVLIKIHQTIPQIKDPDWAIFCYFTLYDRMENNVPALLAMGDELVTYVQRHKDNREQLQFFKEEVNRLLVLEERNKINNDDPKLLKYGLLSNKMLQGLFAAIEAIPDSTALGDEYTNLLRNQSYPEKIVRQIVSQISQHNTRKDIEAERRYLFLYTANEITDWSHSQLIEASIVASLSIESKNGRITALQNALRKTKGKHPDIYRKYLPDLIDGANDWEKTEDKIQTWLDVATYLSEKDKNWMYDVYGYMLGACMDKDVPPKTACTYARYVAFTINKGKHHPHERSNAENMLLTMAHETWRKAVTRNNNPAPKIVREAFLILLNDSLDDEFKEIATDVFRTALTDLKADIALVRCQSILSYPDLPSKIHESIEKTYFRTFLREKDNIHRCILYATAFGETPPKYRPLISERFVKTLDTLSQKDALSTCLTLLQKEAIHDDLRTDMEEYCITRLGTRLDDTTDMPPLFNKLSEYTAALYTQTQDTAFTDSLLVGFEITASQYPEPQDRMIYKFTNKTAPIGSPLKKHLSDKLVEMGEKPFIPGIPVRCSVRLSAPRMG